MRILLVFAFLLFYSLSFTSTASALSIFTDRTAWEAAVGGTVTTDPFDSNKPDAPTITFDSGVVSTGTGGANRNEVFNGQFVANLDTDEDASSDLFTDITWTFPAPIIGFGADWFSTANAELVEVTADFDGTGPQTVIFLDQLGIPGDGFLGFVGNTTFSTAVFTTGNGTPVNEIYFVDNLSFGVPEPSTAVLLLSCCVLPFSRQWRK